MITYSLFLQLIYALPYDNTLETLGNAQRCLDNNQTYILNVHTHIQNEVKDAIVSLTSKSPNSNVLDQIQGISGERASSVATKSYLGTIIEELNIDLEKFNIQINLIFEDQELDQISANGAYDPSCELASPIKERNNSFYTSLTSKLNNVVGIHLSLFGCIYRNLEYELIDVISNSNCGRIIGVMWDGSTKTKTLVKSALMEAFSGARDAYANGFLTLLDRNMLCGYFEKCVGRTPTVHGQLVNFRKSIRYIEDDGCDTTLIHDNDLK